MYKSIFRGLAIGIIAAVLIGSTSVFSMDALASSKAYCLEHKELGQVGQCSSSKDACEDEFEGLPKEYKCKKDK